MPRNHNREYLPSGEILFRVYWVDMGLARSIRKLRIWCAENGYFNPRTGKPPVDMGPWFRMWRWALKAKNFESAYEMYNGAMRDMGQFYSREDFKKFLDDKALTVFSHFPREYKAYQDGRF